MLRKRIQGVIFGNYCINYLREFNLYINIVLIVYILCAKTFKDQCEKIVKRDIQEGITNK